VSVDTIILKHDHRKDELLKIINNAPFHINDMLYFLYHFYGTMNLLKQKNIKK